MRQYGFWSQSSKTSPRSHFATDADRAVWRPDMEKRQHPRFKTCSPMEYHLPVPGLGTTWSLKGVLRDISVGGCRFTCQNRFWMDEGHALDVTVDVSPLRPDSPDISYTRSKGMVVRSGYLGLGYDPWEIGVKFLQPLAFS